MKILFTKVISNIPNSTEYSYEFNGVKHSIIIDNSYFNTSNFGVPLIFLPKINIYNFNDEHVIFCNNIICKIFNSDEKRSIQNCNQFEIETDEAFNKYKINFWGDSVEIGSEDENTVKYKYSNEIKNDSEEEEEDEM